MVVLIIVCLKVSIDYFQNGYAKVGKYIIGEVVSESMYPELKIGEKVLIDTSKKPKLMEVGVYQYGDITVIHRVVRTTKDGDTTLYEFKGDNNTNVDPNMVPSDKVNGTMVWSSGLEIARIINTMKTLIWLVTIVWVGIAIKDSIMSMFKVRKVEESVESEVEKETQEKA